MNKKLKLVTLTVFVLSLLALIWVNVGSRTESGYAACGGGGFIPKSSLPSGPGVYNGICLGQPVTKVVNGRYINTNILNIGLIAVAVLCIVFYLVHRTKSHNKISKA